MTARYNNSALAIATRNKNKYPYNLLFEALPDVFGQKFEKVYIDHLKSLIDIAFDGWQKQIIKMKWNSNHQQTDKSYMPYDLQAVGLDDLSVDVNIILKTIVQNKDVIFNGLPHSKLGKKVKESFALIHLTSDTIDNLINAGYYNIHSILECNGSEFINTLSKKLPSEKVGLTFSETVRKLNAAGYHTSKLGFVGTDASDKQLTEKEFIEFRKSKNSSTVSCDSDHIKINTVCPCCGNKLKITIEKE